jgi:hypothetical protein
MRMLRLRYVSARFGTKHCDAARTGDIGVAVVA